MALMKMKFLAALLAVSALAVGCVSTVNGDKMFGTQMAKDTVEGRYERPLDDVFQAAKDVITFNGVLNNETTLHTETNLVKTVEGKVNQRTVWVRVEAVDPKVTSVQVQARTSRWGADIEEAHEIEKQIALKLVR
jgi:hypothetical protein